MASRHSAARPKRAGENFARTHHHDGIDEEDSKRVKFDVRNPSILAPDAREDDDVLNADVIGGSSATKRGAVNLDGYDSDSDNETFETKAAGRRSGDVNLLKQMDNYDAESAGVINEASGTLENHDDDDDDMFAADNPDTGMAGPGSPSTTSRKRKDVHFLDYSQIDGQEHASKSGGRVRLDERNSSDDEADVDLAIQEEGLDEEVGAGGLKRNAPKIEAFNMREEMEQGRFDQDQNYVRKADDPDASHDNWLEGCSKKDMKKAAEAHEKREAEARMKRIQDDGILVADLLRALVSQLERTETPLEALARLGKSQTKSKKTPKWKQKKMNKNVEDMEVVDTDVARDANQARIKASIDAITEAADKLLSRDFEDVYDQARERLAREYERRAGEPWVEPAREGESEGGGGGGMWEFRWTDGRDGGGAQGPFDGPTMKAWDEAGYFGQGVEFRPAGEGGDWRQEVVFA
ncbi:hypothetical protein XA68_11540 [Ophiocordyceps unilateralis]|uniref:GYF domain-containing protein n=1 Tax=Ophiocordyceps unilateralis TaxID=268505 RepID=A0A2A9PF45_OPHUN|nr:hypothetical protein XA68_11540 [Ophiocordyceps unilateralis]